MMRMTHNLDRVELVTRARILKDLDILIAALKEQNATPELKHAMVTRRLNRALTARKAMAHDCSE